MAEPLDRAAAAQVLGVTVTTIDSYRARKLLTPDGYVGRSPYWYRETLEKFVPPRRTGRPKREKQMIHPKPGYPTAEALMEASRALAAHLNTLTGEQISEIYADGSTVDDDGAVWRPAPDGWVEPDAEMRYFVADTGAAARNTGGQWVAMDPGDDVLSNQGLALWGSEGFGYPITETADA